MNPEHDPHELRRVAEALAPPMWDDSTTAALRLAVAVRTGWLDLSDGPPAWTFDNALRYGVPSPDDLDAALVALVRFEADLARIADELIERAAFHIQHRPT